MTPPAEAALAVDTETNGPNHSWTQDFAPAVAETEPSAATTRRRRGGTIGCERAAQALAYRRDASLCP